MTRHLTDEEIARAITGEPLGGPAARHLEACVACRREADVLRAFVTGERARLEDAAPDWDVQLGAIMGAIGVPAPRRRPLWRPLAAALLAAAAAVAIVLIPEHGAHRQGIAVERVLAEVDATLDDDPLQGFAPLEVLVPDPHELEQYTDTTS